MECFLKPPAWRGCLDQSQYPECISRIDVRCKVSRSGEARTPINGSKQTLARKKGAVRIPKVEENVQVGSEQLLQFERQGHVFARGLFDHEEMAKMDISVSSAAETQKLNAYRHRLTVLCPDVDPVSVHSIDEAESLIRLKGTDELGFLQTFNLHLKSQAVREWASHPRLVTMVAQFLGVKRVRLYQDCLFVKMPGFGVTNWHSDLNMVPIDTNSFLTVWIPLRVLDKNDSSLHFASGSHRDFSLPYWQNNQGMANLESRGYPVASYSNMSLGDATFHHGWTLHWAPGQPLTALPRVAWTVSYFADGARILHTKHARQCVSPHCPYDDGLDALGPLGYIPHLIKKLMQVDRRKIQEEDAWSFQAWRKDLKEGQLVNHPLLPLVQYLNQVRENTSALQRRPRLQSLQTILNLGIGRNVGRRLANASMTYGVTSSDGATGLTLPI